jgi:hypothetical protein
LLTMPLTGTVYSETGLCCSKPVIITDTNAIGVFEEFLGFLFDKLIKSFRTILLHAFKTHEQVDGKLNPSFLVCLNDIQPSQHRAFIISRSPPIQTIRFSIMSQNKWLRSPSILFQSRLSKSALQS